VVHRVKITTKKYQKADMGRTIGSPFKGQIQKSGVRNYLLDSAGAKSQPKQLSGMMVVNGLDNKMRSESGHRRPEALRLNLLTPVDLRDSGSSTLVGPKKSSTAQNAGSNSVSASSTITKPMETKRPNWGLSDEEKSLYGDRCPEEYEKLELLGR